LGEVVRLFEGQSELVECISDPGKCDMSDDCRVRLAWQDATKALYRRLDATTIADLMPGEALLNGSAQACRPKQKQRA